MQSRYLTTSIDYPEGSSGGVFLTDFTTQCDPTLFKEVVQTAGTEQQFSLRWQQDISGARFSHIVSFPPQGTSKEPNYRETLKLRILCHFFLNLIPDEGLLELCESMSEIFDFYNNRVSFQPQASLGNVSVRGRLGQSYVRPEFPIADEQQ